VFNRCVKQSPVYYCCVDGRITGLARPSFHRLSVPYELLTPKNERCRKKNKIGVNVPQGMGVTGVPISTSKGRTSGGRPQNMSALGRHSFLVITTGPTLFSPGNAVVRSFVSS